MEPSRLTELALQLDWTQRLELAQRLLQSLHPQTEKAAAVQPVKTSISLPRPVPQLESRVLKLESVSVSFRKLRDALESDLESQR